MLYIVIIIYICKYIPQLLQKHLHNLPVLGIKF